MADIPSGLDLQTDKLYLNDFQFINNGVTTYLIDGATYRGLLDDMQNAPVNYYFDNNGSFVACFTQDEMYQLGTAILTAVGTYGVPVRLSIGGVLDEDVGWMYEEAGTLYVDYPSEQLSFVSGDTSALSGAHIIQSLSKLFPDTEGLDYQVVNPLGA